ncbi:MAG: response regulator [Candidatus Methanoperedens sp.]|nr:response regulator [Candidatus Methanoperedens sp.]
MELEMQNEELRRTQSELEDSRNRYSNLYDFAPIGYFTFDKNGLIIEVNLTGANKLRIERSFLIKTPFSLYVDFNSKDVFYRHLRNVFRTKTRQSCEIRLVDKNKNQFDVQLESLAVQDREGNFSQCRTAIIDITERKRLESQLLRAQRMESIGILSGGIAHNLNNMLTPMMLSLRMLKEKFKDEQSQKLLTILEMNSQRSADLIKQVMSFARGVEGERKPLEVTHLISEIEKIAEETFPRDIKLQTDVPDDLFTISGDATQLHQVIMNLCVNARDAMPGGGVLSIIASNFFVDKNYVMMHTDAKVGSYVVIAVSDTGTGISPKIMDRIFEPFFTTKEHGKGTGLGLSTALAIVKSHGGFINVYSEIGKGTAFRIYLPAIKTEIAEIHKVCEERKQPELLAGKGEWILVVEDEEAIRNVTFSILEDNGYKVLNANDGAEAVALYAGNIDKIKVILMDMMMPVMDGQSSIRAIRRINPDVKIIAVSGLTEKDRLAKVSDLADAFLPKPYTTGKLLKTIHEVLCAK